MEGAWKEGAWRNSVWREGAWRVRGKRVRGGRRAHGGGRGERGKRRGKGRVVWREGGWRWNKRGGWRKDTALATDYITTTTATTYY